MTTRTSRKTKIQRFLVQDGIEVTSPSFNYIVYAVMIYEGGMPFDSVAEKVSKKFGILEDSFRTLVSRAVKNSVTLPNPSPKKYIAYVYTRTI